MENATKERVILATVTVIQNEETGSAGRGFFVHGGYIITAAHCVPWSNEGDMILSSGDFAVKVVTATGSVIRGQIIAVDPASDIAVIAAPDNQRHPEEWQSFLTTAESIEPLVLCDDEFASGEAFPAHVFTHQGGWVSGDCEQFGENAPHVWLTAAAMPNATRLSLASD
jgi:hypothetical protein